MPLILSILSGHLIDMSRCLFNTGHTVLPKSSDDQGFGDLDSVDLVWGQEGIFVLKFF